MLPENLTPCEVRDVAASVLRAVGPTAAAFACGTRNRRDVQSWANGDTVPSDDELECLLVIDKAFNIVENADDNIFARRWFVGRSCGADNNMSPMMAIRTRNYDDALASAKRIAEDTWL